MRIVVLSLLLSGCVVGTRNADIDEGVFRVTSDCEGNTVEVELNLDRAVDKQKVEVKR